MNVKEAVAGAFARSRRATRKAQPERAHPVVERLEDRTLLSFFFTNQHTDMGATYRNGTWTLFQNNKDTNPIGHYRPDRVVLEFLPKSQTTQTSDPRYAFLGAGAGNPIWIVPIDPRDPELLQLGVSGEDIPTGTFASYNETDPRINNVIPFPWVKFSVVGVEGPGYFSVWQVDSLTHDPTVWVATSPGGNSNPNIVFSATGAHVDYNWAFTQPGDYTIGIRVSAFLPDMTPTMSEVVLYHFQVDPMTTAGQTSGGLTDAQLAALPQVEATALPSPASQLPASTNLPVSSTASASLAPVDPAGSATLDQFFASGGQNDRMAFAPVAAPVGAAPGLGDTGNPAGLTLDMSPITP